MPVVRLNTTKTHLTSTHSVDSRQQLDSDDHGVLSHAHAQGTGVSHHKDREE